MKSIESKNSSQINNWSNFLLLISFLAFLLLSYLIYQRYNPQKLAFDMPEINAAENLKISEQRPVGLKINSIDLSLPIILSEIKNNQWQATTEGVSLLKTSAVPGEVGNSVIYGHNWPNLLGNLKRVQPGDKLIVIFSDNSSKEFEVEYKVEVDPEETSILENSNDHRLTIYTCSGFLDSKRVVIVAKLI